MRLPNAEDAVVDIAKLKGYCLSATHPRGKHKARVFLAVLNLSISDADELRIALLAAAREREAQMGDSDSFGIRYIIDFEMRRGERIGSIRSCWIVLTGELVPRFVTCFVV